MVQWYDGTLGIRIKVPNRHSIYGRVKVKTIQLFLGKYIVQTNGMPCAAIGLL